MLECGDSSDAIMTDVLMCLHCRMMGSSDSLDMGKKIRGVGVWKAIEQLGFTGQPEILKL